MPHSIGEILLFGIPMAHFVGHRRERDCEGLRYSCDMLALSHEETASRPSSARARRDEELVVEVRRVHDDESPPLRRGQGLAPVALRNCDDHSLPGYQCGEA